MATLQESMQNLRGKTYTKVKRNDRAYQQCEESTVEELERLVDLYRNNVFEEDMQARLWRDRMDNAIRRYQEYAIQGRIRSHYNQRSVSLAARDVTFEHVVPVAVIRDNLIEGNLTVKQAINMPTCRVSKTVDQALRAHGLHDNTTDGWNFFGRYSTVADGIEIETYNGQVVPDVNTWTLQDHFDFFGIGVA
jgi:hypothetical protein